MEQFIEVLKVVWPTVGVGLALWGGWAARRKLSAEADKIKAERDSIVVSSAEGAVQLANKQMADIQYKMTEMEAKLAAYQAAVEKATSAEIALRLELGRVKKRVAVLEEYIAGAGLPVPAEI